MLRAFSREKKRWNDSRARLGLGGVQPLRRKVKKGEIRKRQKSSGGRKTRVTHGRGSSFVKRLQRVGGKEKGGKANLSAKGPIEKRCANRGSGIEIKFFRSSASPLRRSEGVWPFTWGKLGGEDRKVRDSFKLRRKEWGHRVIAAPRLEENGSTCSGW